MSETQEKDGLLFREFQPSSKEEWIEKAISDLKGADFDKRLVWKNLNDIEVQPFYTLEDRQRTLDNSGRIEEKVVNYRRIERGAANKNALALQALEEGMDGIVFEVDPSDHIEDLLEHIEPEKTALSFSLRSGVWDFSDRLFKFYSSLDLDKEKVRGYIETPLLSEFLTEGILSEQLLDDMARATRIFEDYPRLKTLTLSGREYLDSGGSQVQEIAFSLNSVVFMVEAMKERGLDENLIFRKLNLIMAIGSEYFVEISKLRALNSLFHRVAEKYGVREPDFTLVSRSSIWTKSVLDCNTNMLRATTEAMSAILGNTNALEIDPYDRETGTSRDLSRRIAGNIATILREESYFGKVRNPVDGAYYIEELSHELAEKALELFKEIEKIGGFVEAFRKEVIQSRIAMVRTSRIKLMGRRRRVQVGVNKYPNLMERLSTKMLCREIPPSNSRTLRPRRAGLEVEWVRANTERWVEQTGRRPVVEFAAYGNLAMRKARAGFAYDFLGVGGYQMEEERSFASYLEAAESSARSGSDIVVICSSDEDYRETALDFVKEFRALDSSKVLVLAGYPEDSLEKLTRAGLDAFIHQGADIVGTLNLIHKKISGMPKKPKI